MLSVRTHSVTPMSPNDAEPGSDHRTVPALLEVIDHLCDQWAQFVTTEHPQPFTHLRGSRSAGAAPATHALAMHATHTARAASTLIRQNHPPAVAMPLIRQTFECGVTAQWLAQVHDAADTWGHSALQRTARMARRMRDSGAPHLAEVADYLEDNRLNRRVDLPEAGHGGSFFDVVRDLFLNDKETYVLYSTVSEFSHASIMLTESYATARNDDGSLILEHRPEGPNPDLWLHLAASGLVWAQMAANYTDHSRQLRNSLRRTARELGIDPDLQQTEHALTRQFRRPDPEKP